jgi:DNA-binding NtrC family response regulator
MLVHVLVGASPHEHLRRLCSIVKEGNTLVAGARTEQDLWERLARENYDLVIVDRSAFRNFSETDVAEIRQLPDHPEVVVLCRDEDPERGAALQRAGCLAVIDLAVSDAMLHGTLRSLVQRRRGNATPGLSAVGDGEVSRLSSFVSASETMQAFLAVASRIIRTNSTVLVLGETGTGKEWLARAIHAEGSRGAAPFVAVNCAALPESLLESELFGHKRGAFTGATRSRRGYFELAHGGTIFLDEIAELPLHLQSRLLRVLEERKIQPIGAEKAIPIDVRVMAATNRNLETEMVEKRFRPDLYYRLNVVSLTLPPLRDRREDVPELVVRYINQFRMRLGTNVTGIHPTAMEALVEYDWPGNVRELINAIERATLLCRGNEITLRDLPEPVVGDGMRILQPAAAIDSSIRLGSSQWLDLPWPEARRRILESAERAYFEQLLETCEGRVGDTARRAGIDPRSLYEKMQRHGLRKEQYRTSGAAPSKPREVAGLPR